MLTTASVMPPRTMGACWIMFGKTCSLPPHPHHHQPHHLGQGIQATMASRKYTTHLKTMSRIISRSTIYGVTTQQMGTRTQGSEVKGNEKWNVLHNHIFWGLLGTFRIVVAYLYITSQRQKFFSNFVPIKTTLYGQQMKSKILLSYEQNGFYFYPH